MELETEPLSPSSARLICRGRFNMAAVPAFRDHLDKVLGEGRTHVIVDLADTTFIDSSGLGALIAGLKRSRQSSGDLRIARPSEQVQSTALPPPVALMATPLPVPATAQPVLARAADPASAAGRGASAAASPR